MLEAQMSTVATEESTPEVATDPAPGEAPLPQSRIAELAQHARPAEVSASAQYKLFEEWERAGITIQKAAQMHADAIQLQIQCVEKIVSKLGGGAFRYKDKLYLLSVSSKGTVYLREQKPRVKRG
jgi:hypothetical protein